MINVQKVAADAAADASLVNELASLVNRVYAIAEDGLWTAGTSRTDARENRPIDRRRAESQCNRK